MKLPAKNEIRKPSKTLAGVTPIAVMLKPRKCKHGTCLYCPSLNVPQSYTPLSPPVLRSKILKYNPFSQVKVRLRAYKLMHHPTSKIELIIMGGTFLNYPKKYQESFIKTCYDALNSKKAKNLESAKKLNQNSKHRCVALCIETRPDFCSDKYIKQMLNYGATRVELGVQAIDDKIYKKINRGHKVKDVILATKNLRNAGFKIGYHLMLGLPGSNEKKDLQMFKKIFSSQNFKPDQLKIYPCQVIKGAKLVNWYKQGKYKPYTKQQLEKILEKIFKLIPNYCRVMRVMREIPPAFLVAGTTRIDLRALVEDKLRKQKAKLQEIRFREIGFNPQTKNTKLKLKITKYQASGGKEYFLEFVNKENILFGLLRLRIIKNKKQNQAFIRELHVYGKSLSIGKKSKFSFQHKGLGKMLLAKAEEICKKNNINKLKIISGVGARQYYKKLGYELVEPYMLKELS